MPNSRSTAKESAVAAHDDNNEVSNDDFNTMMDKKLNEFESSIISQLTENMKVLIQLQFQNIIQEYKNQSEEVSSTVAMRQQHMANLKQENGIFKKTLGKIDRKKMSSMVDASIWELKTERNNKENPLTKSWKQPSVCLVRQVSISQMLALIVHIVSVELMTRW